ncbi:MAG: 4-hydroxy-2-oxovalerate aldolase [Proteobacteria bacterium]|nr:4-hydroxy-2-oxovalerate aldolase [Pseudomonadota bacterium]
MSSFKLLDVTLRDGGHHSNFHFTDEQLDKIIPAIDATKVDFIEVGYRGGSISPIPNIGIAGLCPDEYLLKCQKLIKNTKMAVMVHCQNINKDDIKALKKCGVSLVRLCIQKGEHKLAIPFIGYAKEAGMLVSTNFIHISQYPQDVIIEAVDSVIPYEPSMIYFADSNGCLHTHRVTALYEYFTKHYNIPFGYHAHDNIGLAQTNVLAALNAGAKFVDASLAGASKGIGNLKLEFFVAYLYSIKNYQFELEPLIAASNYVRDIFPECGDVSEGEFLRGIFDFSTKQLAQHIASGKKGFKQS